MIPPLALLPAGLDRTILVPDQCPLKSTTRISFPDGCGGTKLVFSAITANNVSRSSDRVSLIGGCLRAPLRFPTSSNYKRQLSRRHLLADSGIDQ